MYGSHEYALCVNVYSDAICLKKLGRFSGAVLREDIALSLPFDAIGDGSSTAGRPDAASTVRRPLRVTAGERGDASRVTSDADRRLLQPFRPVRRMPAGDVPWSGMLVRLESGESLVLVDAGDVPQDWSGWRAAPDGHVLGAVDIVRHGGGHSVALPLSTERVEDFLTRRLASRVPLSAGELVTLAVSLVRGIGSLDSAAPTTGEWWLTDAGRPVIATETSTLDAPTHTADLLRGMATGTPSDEILLAAAEAVGAPRRSSHELRLVEERLFAAASPEPLVTSLLGPRFARDAFAFDRETVAVERDDAPSSWVDMLARNVDADLADAVSRVTTGVWRRVRSGGPSSRRPWLLAAATAAVLVTAGLLWPTDAGGPATADVKPNPTASLASGSRTPTADAPTATPAPTASRAAPGATPEGLVDVTNRLLLERTACAGDRECLGGVMLDPATAFDAGPIDLEPAERTITLLDDFGGVAVLRVDAAGSAKASQLVVVMLDGDRWLLRDVHTAKQP
jgi:hypothetical protein